MHILLYIQCGLWFPEGKLYAELYLMEYFMTFTPLFTKPIRSKGKTLEVTFPKEDLESVILELSENKFLIGLMLDYINFTRRGEVSISREEEISLRQKIFPYFDELMGKRGLHSIFSPDVSEEMFQRLERGVLEVRS